MKQYLALGFPVLSAAAVLALLSPAPVQGGGNAPLTPYGEPLDIEQEIRQYQEGALPQPPASVIAQREKRGFNFIRSAKDIPPFDVPSYKGARYEALVPATLDIQERAALAVNALTSMTDAERNYLIYAYVNFSANPPVALHISSDIVQFGFMNTLPLMRLISGSDQNSAVDRVWMTSALRMIGPDGLVYWPAFPWARGGDYWGDHGPGPEGDQYAEPLFNGEAIDAMTLYMLRDPRGPWRGEIERVVQALDKIVIHKEDYAYFPEGGFTPGGLRPRDAEPPLGRWTSLAGWVAGGLTRFYSHSDDPTAIKLAADLSRYMQFRGYWYGPEGEWLPNYPIGAKLVTEHKAGVHPFVPETWAKNFPAIHFEHHVDPLEAMLDVAVATGDRGLAEFVRKSYEWGKNQGETTVGYFPESILTEVPYGDRQVRTAETCAVAGMIGLALKLSAAGIGDYWDDADRWIRNQFAEDQLQRADWAYQFSREVGGQMRPNERVPHSEVPPNGRATVDHVPERCLGSFAGWPSANDWMTGQGAALMNCCMGTGSRCLYYIWENMLTFRSGELRVNLLLNRPSRWADVLSYIPYEGKVEVRVKEACRLKIRIPQWAEPNEVTCSVDENAHPLTWEGRYAVVGEVSPKQVVLLSFPIEERSVQINVEHQLYTLVIKGNDVVKIDPPGRYCPFYQRDEYRDTTVHWKKMQRFVSDEDIAW